MELYAGDNISEKKLQMIKNQAEYNTTTLDITDSSNSKSNSTESKKRMHRITICVSNDCNLRCKYCYAKGGNYGQNRSLMSKKTAKSIVEFCTTNFSYIESVTFFGGEPLLNYPIIDYICNLFKEQSLNASFILPSFSIITNGTICNDDIINLIRNNISFITVSIDGCKTINDKNRVFKNGSGSFERIKQFINTCKEKTSAKLQFEATYTLDHINLGISRSNVYSYLNTKFGIDGIVVDEDSLSRNLKYEYLQKLTNKELLETDFECLPIDCWQVALTLATKKSHRFCGIFDDRVTITVNGNIVGCQMFIGNEMNNLCNIYEPNATKIIEKHVYDFKNNPFCSKCWCKKLCGGCVFQHFYSKKENQLKTVPNNEYCLLTRLYLEEILHIIFKIRTDKELWPLFIKKAKLKLNS